MTEAIRGKRWFRPAIHPKGDGIISAYMVSNSEEVNKQRHRDLWDDLTFLGYTGLKAVKGEWRGVPEIAIAVPNVALTDLKNLGSRYGQDAFVWQKHIYNVRMGSMDIRPIKIANRWLGQTRQNLERALRELDLDPNDPKALREIQRHKKMLTPEYVLTDKDWKDLIDVFGKRLAQELWKGYRVEIKRYAYWPAPPLIEYVAEDLEEFVDDEFKSMMEDHLARNPHLRRVNWQDPGYDPPDVDIPARITLWGHADTDTGIWIEGDNSSAGTQPPPGSYTFTVDDVELTPGMDFRGLAEELAADYENAYIAEYGTPGPIEQPAIYIGDAKSLEKALQDIPYNREYKWDRADPKYSTFSTEILRKDLTEFSLEMVISRLDGKKLSSTEFSFAKKVLKI